MRSYSRHVRHLPLSMPTAAYTPLHSTLNCTALNRTALNCMNLTLSGGFILPKSKKQRSEKSAEPAPTPFHAKCIFLKD